MDLQKDFQLPFLTHSTMYYSRQLGCYNFGIHVHDTSDGAMCMWHEGEASRGGNEMASALLHALNDIISNISNKKKLIIWSDNCAGQIKNRMLVFLYLFLVELGLYEQIDHKFLQVGHSFSASDRDFALIEKRWKTSKCQVMEDVEAVIKEARPSRRFKTLTIGGRFLDFDQAAKRFINTKSLQISKLCWL